MDGVCSSVGWSAAMKRARRTLSPWARLHGSMWVTPTRQGKRKACVAGILFLAGVLAFHGTISLKREIAPEPSGNSSSAAAAEACEWSEGMPDLYVLKHSRGHPKGEHKWRRRPPSGAEHWCGCADAFPFPRPETGCKGPPTTRSKIK